MELKDHETEGHSKRVTAFTVAIARAMGLPREQKVAIPTKILIKPGKLEPEEMTIMKEHAYHGYQIVKKVPFLVEAAEIVYSHQE